MVGKKKVHKSAVIRQRCKRRIKEAIRVAVRGAKVEKEGIVFDKSREGPSHWLVPGEFRDALRELALVVICVCSIRFQLHSKPHAGDLSSSFPGSCQNDARSSSAHQSSSSSFLSSNDTHLLISFFSGDTNAHRKRAQRSGRHQQEILALVCRFSFGSVISVAHAFSRNAERRTSRSEVIAKNGHELL